MNSNYTNWFGDSAEDKEKRRQILRQAYDKATEKENKQEISQGPLMQTIGALSDLGKEYLLMHSHNYKNLDDYYHCKGNFNAAKRGFWGEKTAEYAGYAKEKLDSYKNKYYKGIQDEDVEKDFYHDLNINKDGINKSKIYNQQTAQDVCAEYREKNKHLPRRYW